MPLTLIVTEGVIPKHQERVAIARLSETFLEVHGLAGNKFLTPNVIGHVQVLAKESTFSGMEPASVAMVEWKLPSFAFGDRDAQVKYVERVTDILHELSGGKLPKDRIWVNVTHTVDGPWGIAGKAYTNAELGAMASRG